MLKLGFGLDDAEAQSPLLFLHVVPWPICKTISQIYFNNLTRYLFSYFLWNTIPFLLHLFLLFSSSPDLILLLLFPCSFLFIPCTWLHSQGCIELVASLWIHYQCCIQLVPSLLVYDLVISFDWFPCKIWSTFSISSIGILCSSAYACLFVAAFLTILL